MNIRAQLLAAIRALVVFTILTGLAYPLVVTALAQVVFDSEADGSLLTRDSRVVGSALIGQTFTSDEYFHGRPSAAGTAASGSLGDDGRPADPEDLSVVASGASNLGPTNSDLPKTVAARAASYPRRTVCPTTSPSPSTR